MTAILTSLFAADVTPATKVAAKKVIFLIFAVHYLAMVFNILWEFTGLWQSFAWVRITAIESGFEKLEK